MTIRLSPLDSSARLVPRVADQTTVLCPICGQPNPATAKQCAACGITFATGRGTEKVDAILEDRIDFLRTTPGREGDAAGGTLLRGRRVRLPTDGTQDGRLIRHARNQPRGRIQGR